MREIIDELYDITTATKIGLVGPGPSMDENNIRFHVTTLYRTRRGDFFIVGWGNCGSLWAKYLGCAYTSGGGVKPIGDHKARRLVRNSYVWHDYEEIFGETHWQYERREAADYERRVAADKYL